MSQETIGALWARVMDFDKIDFKAVGPEGAPPIEGWLLRNRDAWLNPMRRPNVGTAFSERVFIVVGEAGSGKTTLMDLVADDARADGAFTLYFDFKNAPTLTGELKGDAAVRELSDYMRNSIELAVEEAGLTGAYKAARVRLVLRNRATAEFTALQDKYPGLKKFTDAQLLACLDVIDEALRFEDEHPEQFISVVAAQFIVDADRCLLLVDNVEGVSAGMRETLFQKLTAVQQARTLLLVALRSENQHQAEVLLQGRRDEPYALERERDSLMTIARVRNDGARRICLEMYPDLLAKDVDDQHKRFEQTLRLIEKDEYLFTLITKWLNDNVRHFLTLMAEISMALPALDGRSERGFVSTRLLERRSHSSLQKIFDKHSVPTVKHKQLPFVFLPWRILSYLERRNSLVALPDMIADFHNSFGVNEADLRRALSQFVTPESGKPYPLRIEETRDGGQQVHLLGCGETFVNHVIFQCDYLQTLFDRVENPPEVPASLGYSERKLARSLAVINGLIVPGFLSEHPYLKPRVRATRSMHVRLSAYEHMFGFGSSNWFVGKLTDRLGSYAKSRTLAREAAPTLARLQQMSERLDRVAAGGR